MDVFFILLVPSIVWQTFEGPTTLNKYTAVILPFCGYTIAIALSGGVTRGSFDDFPFHDYIINRFSGA
jgi:hypothetical protein